MAVYCKIPRHNSILFNMKKLSKIKLNDFNEISNAEMKKIVGGNIDCGERQTLFHCTGTMWGHDASGYACGTSANATSFWVWEGFVDQVCVGIDDPIKCYAEVSESGYDPKCS